MNRIALLALTLFVAAAPGGEPAATPATYTWKPGDVYRFEYSKTTTISSSDPADPAQPRKTEIGGVLILEISTESTAALLRFDAAHIALPPVEIYSSLTDDPEPLKDKNRIIARAVEGALKGARWDVLLATDGTIHIRERKPANFQEWTKEVETLAQWRKKSLKFMEHLVGEEIGLKPKVDDQELLLCLGPPSSAPRPPVAAHLHPQRTELTLVSREADKMKYAFKRAAPELAGKPYALQDLGAVGEVTATVEKVRSDDGSAVFDAKLGALDLLTEDYTTEITLRFGSDTMKRGVRVQYRLKRLAPPVAK
jgi:hypothetical protein